MKTLTKDNVKFIVVHASATSPRQDIGRKDIDRWHRQRGWLQIGYHYVIRRDGTLEHGRPLEMPGAHVSGHNHHSVGICMVGGVDDNQKSECNYTPEQFATLSSLLDYLEEYFPNAQIQGHRDFPGVAKDCPCFDVREWRRTGQAR